MKKKSLNQFSLPQRVNRILNILLVLLILIAIRLGQLTIVEHDSKVQAAHRPQQRTLFERAERAKISDRFGQILAENRVQYNASICYSQISALPRWTWKRNKDGKREKFFLRKEYITQLSCKLALLLRLDSEWVEDMIHSKAALMGGAPCVLQENISEKTYFQLKMLESSWPGICAEHVAKRHYPMGKVASHIIGYMGAISANEYQAVEHELRDLHETIALYEEIGPSNGAFSGVVLRSAKKRLQELQDKAYSINDLVGKEGIEGGWDDFLRGARGKKVYLTDRRGHLLRQIGGQEPAKVGEHLQLTISAELQEYAERLLIENEERAQTHALSQSTPKHVPWIKGGAIIAMDPKNGEVIALASYPRFDPNFFIKSGRVQEDRAQQKSVLQYLEGESYLRNVWDHRTPLQRERFDAAQGTYYDETLDLDWKTYLDFIMPEKSVVRVNLDRFNQVHESYQVQRWVEQLLALFADEQIPLSASKIFNLLFQQESDVRAEVRTTLPELAFLQERIVEKREEVAELKKRLDPYFSDLRRNEDKLLFIDLCRLVVDHRTIDADLYSALRGTTLGGFRDDQMAKSVVEEALKELVYDLFCEHDFKAWRQEFFAEYLQAKRQEEKEESRWARPYLDYLNAEKKLMFAQFWQKHRLELFCAFLLPQEPGANDLSHYLETLALWQKELAEGAHKGLVWNESYHALKSSIESLDRTLCTRYLKALRSFDELDRPLLGSYGSCRREEGVQLEKHLASAFHPLYGYGYLRSHGYRQAATVGSIFKLVCAYEALKQRYLALQGENVNYGNLNPLTIIDDKHRVAKNRWNVGYTTNGKPIPVYYKGGRLPRSEHAHMGKMDLLGALEASSNPYFSIVAAHKLQDPEDLCHAAKLFGFGTRTGIDLPGEYRGHLPIDVAYNRTGLYAMAIGQHSLTATPLQTAVMLAAIANKGEVVKPQIVKSIVTEGQLRACKPQTKRTLFLPDEVEGILLRGLSRVVSGEKGTARYIRRQFPDRIVKHLIGKTSTAQLIEKLSLDGAHKTVKGQDIWFGSIYYDPDKKMFIHPELVVVVYLRHGKWGRLAAPLAAKVIQRWQEIKQVNS